MEGLNERGIMTDDDLELNCYGKIESSIVNARNPNTRYMKVVEVCNPPDREKDPYQGWTFVG